eukprot:552501-Pyramimonas_sp.AAC.1
MGRWRIRYVHTPDQTKRRSYSNSIKNAQSVCLWGDTSVVEVVEVQVVAVDGSRGSRWQGIFYASM